MPKLSTSYQQNVDNLIKHIHGVEKDGGKEIHKPRDIVECKNYLTKRRFDNIIGSLIFIIE